MKHGKTIVIKDSRLKAFRDNLRKLILIAASDYHRSLIDYGTNLVMSGRGVKHLNEEVTGLYSSMCSSICSCKFCNTKEEDRIFVDFEEMLSEIAYPPISSKRKNTFWLCPNCYDDLVKRFLSYRKEGFYYFSEYGVMDTLEALGINSLEESKKLKFRR